MLKLNKQDSPCNDSLGIYRVRVHKSIDVMKTICKCISSTDLVFSMPIFVLVSHLTACDWLSVQTKKALSRNTYNYATISRPIKARVSQDNNVMAWQRKRSNSQKRGMEEEKFDRYFIIIPCVTVQTPGGFFYQWHVVVLLSAGW